MMDAESIDDTLGADHARLSADLDQLREALVRRSDVAPKLLGRFSEGLLRHMTWEEKELFPAALARANSAQRRSIESLEIDHERIRDTLTALESSLAAGDSATADKLIDWLGTLLKGHNYDEEHGVYEETDRLFSLPERRMLLEKFKSAP